MRRSSASKGFTIIELLVSLGIITVITGMMMANFRTGSQSSELRFAAEILVNQYREAQTSAFASRLAVICSGGGDNLKTCGAVDCDGGTCQDRPAPGYGVRLSGGDERNITLFYDGNDNGIYDAGEERAVQPLVSTGAVDFTGSTAGDPLDIVFKPPSATMTINGLGVPPDTVTVTLRHRGARTERHVNLFRISGKIDHD